jgi:hypothetical protein
MSAWSRPAFGEMIRFGVDHTLFLNIAFLVVAGALSWLHLRGASDQARSAEVSERA